MSASSMIIVNFLSPSHSERSAQPIQVRAAWEGVCGGCFGGINGAATGDFTSLGFPDK